MTYLLNSNDLNDVLPQMMHIDLNSAFATIEQQANPLLRGRPVGVCSYLSPKAIILAASYEAKRLGIGVGTPIWQAKELCKDIVCLMPDPAKYYYVNARMYKLLYSYTSDITPLSIDEFVLDFSKSRSLRPQSLTQIAKEIKRRIHYEIGDWMRVNIGIAPNRFLAKLAAGLRKPNGLDVLSHHNLEEVYSKLELKDLCGINYRMEARLNAENIFTPLEFLAASSHTLHRRVYKSIEGYRWHQRLRGYEVDGVVYGRKSYGNDFAMPKPSADKHYISKLLMKLCVKTGKRLRKDAYYASGAQLWVRYDDDTSWHKSTKSKGSVIYSDNDIFNAIMRVFTHQPEKKTITNLSVSIYGLVPTHPEQLELVETIVTKQRKIAAAVDKANDRYGDFTIVPALMMKMEDLIIQRVPFGASKDLKEIYLGYQDLI